MGGGSLIKTHLNIVPKRLGLPGEALDTNDEWFDRLGDFLPKLSALIERQVTDDERIEYGDKLVRGLNQLAKFSYLVRRERDQALARGYEKYPKGEYNSDAATALARQFASEEVRLRDLLSEMEDALKLRASLNQSAVSYMREQMKNAG